MKWVEVPEAIIEVYDFTYYKESGYQIRLCDIIDVGFSDSPKNSVLVKLKNHATAGYRFHYDTKQDAREAADEIRQVWEEWREKG